jgi:hypothetical protein
MGVSFNIEKRIATAVLMAYCCLIPLNAAECRTLQKSYTESQQAYEVQQNSKTQRQLYALSNRLIDSGMHLLAYCHGELSLSQRHRLRTELKRLDSSRADHAKGAIREYHVKHGIEPNVKTIYQDRPYSGSSPGTQPSAPSKYLPAVNQPMMPPVSK